MSANAADSSSALAAVGQAPHVGQQSVGYLPLSDILYRTAAPLFVDTCSRPSAVIRLTSGSTAGFKVEQPIRASGHGQVIG